MLTAVRSGDTPAYLAALRDARLIVPILAGPQTHYILLDLEGVRHVAVFTSEQLARQGVTQYLGGDAAGWTNATYLAGELTNVFAADQRLLVDPGSPLQGTFTPSDMIVHQATASVASAPPPSPAPAVTAPRQRRGSIRNGLLSLVVGVVLLIIAFGGASDPVTCGSQVMEADDTCIELSNGNRRELNFEQMQRSGTRLRIGNFVAGGVLTIAGIYLLGARIATSRR